MIRITNDKKDKPQSWEAAYDADGGGSNGLFVISLNGFGKDGVECRMNLMKEIDKLIHALEELRFENNKGVRELSPIENERSNKDWAIICKEEAKRMESFDDDSEKRMRPTYLMKDSTTEETDSSKTDTTQCKKQEAEFRAYMDPKRETIVSTFTGDKFEKQDKETSDIDWLPTKEQLAELRANEDSKRDKGASILAGSVVEKLDKEIAKHDNELLNRNIACGFPCNRSFTNADAFHIGVDIGDGPTYSATTPIEGSVLVKGSLPKVRYGKLGHVAGDVSDKSEDNNQLNKNKDMSKGENKVTKVEDNVLKFREITKSMNELYEAKNKDYGDSFNKTMNEYGLVAAAVKLDDKLRRFKKLLTVDAKVKDESIKDTLIDLANYSVMTLLFLNEKESHEWEGKI